MTTTRSPGQINWESFAASYFGLDWKRFHPWSSLRQQERAGWEAGAAGVLAEASITATVIPLSIYEEDGND